VNPRDKSFEELVSRIDDGRPIDWDLEARQVSDEGDRHLVNALKTLAEVAAGFRGTASGDAAPAATAGQPWGDLTVYEVVGRGAFSTVHRAVDRLHRTVALKLLDPGLDVSALKARMLEEGRLLASVRHQNIAVVYGPGESDGRVGLSMEFIDGVTLAVEGAGHGPMSAEEAATIGRRLCAALVAIHGAGCVHGDVKAQNVMRERGGRIVLMDFGASQALADGGTRLAGTPLYLSPERLAGAPASPACDIYALGVLLYFLVTGAYPVDGDTREDVERAHVDGRRVRLRDRRSDLPDAFVAAVEGAIAPDPSARHPTAGAFDAALARVTNEPIASTSAREAARPSSDGPLDHGDATRPSSRLRRWIMPAVAAAIVAASATAILWVTGGSPPRVAPAPDQATVVVPPPSADYVVQAAFYRVDEKSREAKVSGTRISRGDVLELDLRLSRDATVYVVNEDEQGSASLLFPLAGGTLRNPLRGGQQYTLPGPSDSEPVQWAIDSFGGREHFYVIVAPAVDATIQAAIARLTPASDNPSPALTARAEPQAGGLRGAGKLAHVRVAPGAADAPWRRLARPLSQQQESARGLWIRELTLENPRPR